MELDSVHHLEREADLEYFDRVELEFRVQAALDVAGVTESVLLARKQVVTNWFAHGRSATAGANVNGTGCDEFLVWR